MSEDKTIQYKIVNKNGEVVEDESFNDYDKLADHMLNLAEKWYNGLYDSEDSLEISTFDKTGEIIYSDTATFGETMNDQSDLENELKQLAAIKNGSAGQGFGDSTPKSRKKNRKS